MQIIVTGSKQAWKSDDGQKVITSVFTADNKKLKSWSADWISGQTYNVTITEKASKNPKFGTEYWVDKAEGSDAAPAATKGSDAAPATTKAPYVPENKNRSFALSYAKDLTVAMLADPEQAAKVDPIVTTLTIADAMLDWLDGKKPEVTNTEDLPY